MRPSVELQAFLDATIASLGAKDPNVGRSKLRVALVDLGRGNPPRLAHCNGETPVYPASVIKFVYLMAAYAWQEEGRLRIDDDLDSNLTHMIFESSNQATQRVFARLTGTEPGPELPPDAYAAYRERRLAVQRWLDGLGVPGLHCVNPTYDGDGDLAGRDRQFVGDHTVGGGLPADPGALPNRNSMTAIGTAKSGTSSPASREEPLGSPVSKSTPRAVPGARSMPTPGSSGTRPAGRSSSSCSWRGATAETSSRTSRSERPRNC